MRSQRMTCAAMLLGLLTACGGTPSTPGDTHPSLPPPTNTVSGQVTFKGAALAGAQVTVFDLNNNSIFATAGTDSAGHYTVSGLEATGDVPEGYMVWARMPGLGFFPSSAAPGQVVRTGQNVLFPDNGSIGMGIYVTAVSYVSTVAGGSLAGADFAAFDGSNPRVQVGRTGQSSSYAAGDDGALQAGVAWPGVRFTDNQDGTVTDHVTGLVWLKDAGALGSAPWTQAVQAVTQLASGTAGLTDGSTPGAWRLPNLNELESLVDVAAAGPALTPGQPFLHVANGVYWTSTSYYYGENGSPAAWAIQLADGSWVNDGNTNAKTSSNAVWAVKGAGGGALSLPATGLYVSYQAGDDGALQTGVGLAAPRFLDNGDGTVTDAMTGLVWLKQANAICSTWDGALAAVNALASGQCGLTDGSSAGQWRMPNRREMQSLADRMQNNEADYFDFTFVLGDGTVFQAPVFSAVNPSQYYWTSSTTAADPAAAWTVFSCDFGVYSAPKANVSYTMAVRQGP